ncbi:helix-turn-helix domain-containing protein [Sphingobacterium sp. LRF_L2]|uniref:helix-turn-helix domain-containing protein n=1 Tax=Sphingobacterium sp. LRF_L2 TaxID=3369421 RepID=UPI003F62E6BC
MSIKQEDRFSTVNYSGIFLSCFTDFSKRCVHAAPEHALVYVYSGEQIIENGKEKIRVQAGECAFIRRDHRLTIHKNNCENEFYQGITLTFKRDVLRDFYDRIDKTEIPRDVSFTEATVFKITPRPDITSLFQSLTPYFDGAVKPSDDVAYLKLKEGIYALLSDAKVFYPILFDFTEPWKIDILSFLNANYMDDLSLEEIASYTGRSLATFKRDFKKISPITPQKWLIKRRLEEAYHRLKEGQRVREVAHSVGFKNTSHFSTAFKKEYGVPPTTI